MVEFLDLYPLTYIEFLEALGHKNLVSLIKSNNWELIKTFKEKLIYLLRQYYFIGGMPEVVNAFCRNNNFDEVRKLQKAILQSYEQDFSKHAPTETVPRIRMIWNSIPAQLAKENRKFIYQLIRKGARAKEYEIALTWLIDCGLIHKIFRVSKPAIPLKAYTDFSAFKAFIVDVGLLSAMCSIDATTLLKGNSIFTEFKGALTEQYILQQLLCAKKADIYYWTAQNSTAEVDFVIQYNGNVIPIEVKAEENLQAKSLKVYYKKYTPEFVVRTTMSDFRNENWLINIPLYAINQIFYENLTS